MGEAADDAFDSALREYDGSDETDPFLYHPKGSNYQKGTKAYEWRISDGSIVAMDSMADIHLLNAIKLCNKFGNTEKKRHLVITLNRRSIQKEDSYQEFLKRIGETE